MTKTAAVINDLSGLGRCSLTAAIPVLSALGVQACPVPTAVLTAQTGFPGYRLTDLSATLTGTIQHWSQLGMRFDGVSTGFLADAGQAHGVERFLDAFAGPDTLVLADPVMGDDGRVYPIYTPELHQSILSLVRRANVVTPNLTEACLLAGADYRSVTALEGEALFAAVGDIARHIAGLGPCIVAVTGVREGGSIYNLTLSPQGLRFTGAPILGGSYSGTGDLFAAVLHGCLLRGLSPDAAVALAERFLAASLRQTLAEGTDRNQGVCFEGQLSLLTEVVP